MKAKPIKSFVELNDLLKSKEREWAEDAENAKNAPDPADPDLEKSLLAFEKALEAELEKARRSEYLNEDGTFKGGFDGCVAYFRKVRGLPKENAQKLCAFIGRRAGKI